MTNLDWVVLVIYIAGIIGMSILIGYKQRSQEDYYLGGRLIRPWQVALSVMATQVSAISLISAPAFIALRSGGGLIWLQYEFAIPLAMMLIMLILIPVYHHTRGITIYEYLENRFGKATRMILSLVFLISRGLGTGVALLATAIVTSVCLGLSLSTTVIIIGVVSLLYTTIGGIKADIYSDIIQLVVLWGGAFVSIYIIINLLGGDLFAFIPENTARLQVIDFKSTGLGDGQTFAFWPMLIGGFFLYLSYYGCDQSQAQRLLTTSTVSGARWAMLGNGLLRFPLVITYCALGLFLIPFLNKHAEFAAKVANAQPDFLVPYFLIDYFPSGLLGLVVAGIFAASMSSIDSALNSLSAATWRDFIERNFRSARRISPRQMVRVSRLLTVFWGAVATVFALVMIGGPETVLELVNKIGSAFYGPILAIFWLGILTKKASQPGAIIGLVTGVALNIILWLFFENISWMWWNVFGFLLTMIVGYFISMLIPHKVTIGILESHFPIRELIRKAGGSYLYIILAIYFVLIVAFSVMIQSWLASKF